MKFPFSLYDINILLALISIILIIVSEFFNLGGSQLNILIEKNQLQKVIYVICFLFFFASFIRIFELFIK